MNYVLGTILLIASIIIGYAFSSKLKKKRIFYQSFLDFNKLVKGEISYSQNTLIQFINNNSKDDEFNLLVKKYFLENITEFKVNYLTNDEKEYLLQYLKKLGMADSKSQLEYINQTDAVIEKNLADTIYNEKKYSSLYIKLGFLVGLIAFLLCI